MLLGKTVRSCGSSFVHTATSKEASATFDGIARWPVPEFVDKVVNLILGSAHTYYKIVYFKGP